MASLSQLVTLLYFATWIYQMGVLLVALEPIFKKLAEFGFISFEEEGILIHKFPVQFLPSENFIRNLVSMG